MQMCLLSKLEKNSIKQVKCILHDETLNSRTLCLSFPVNQQCLTSSFLRTCSQGAKISSSSTICVQKLWWTQPRASHLLVMFRIMQWQPVVVDRKLLKISSYSESQSYSFLPNAKSNYIYFVNSHESIGSTMTNPDSTHSSSPADTCCVALQGWCLHSRHSTSLPSTKSCTN